jgi:3-deoxy-D-manno-octulosonic-acid transferase
MRILYTFLLHLVQLALPLVGLFSGKLKLFVSGRSRVFQELKASLNEGQPTLWFHAASLGEYEQGLPVMEAIQKLYPEHQLLISFFSPSGYEVKKNTAFAKAVTYLPLDTAINARKFLDIVKPEAAFFIKYEFWPNYLRVLNNRKIRTFLISGVFRKQQPFFKWYGAWMRKSLQSFEHFFLQDADSLQALTLLDFENASVNGDTRFDRVSHQIEMDNTLDFADAFTHDNLCVVCGSTWPEDDAMILPYINTHQGVAKWIIAPHEIKPEKIAAIEKGLEVKSVRYSEREGKNLASYEVLILDTIGILTKVYSYAHIAYVGGAMGATGLHNILEPATFGVPILTGPHLNTFPEARKLRQLAGLYTVSNKGEMDAILTKLLTDPKFRSQTGMISGHYINANTGATQSVVNYLLEFPLLCTD